MLFVIRPSYSPRICVNYAYCMVCTLKYQYALLVLCAYAWRCFDNIVAVCCVAWYTFYIYTKCTYVVYVVHSWPGHEANVYEIDWIKRMRDRQKYAQRKKNESEREGTESASILQKTHSICEITSKIAVTRNLVTYENVWENYTICPPYACTCLCSS